MATRATTATVSTTATEPVSQVLIRAALTSLALVMAVLALEHFRDGRAVDAAVPVPVYMVAQIKVPTAAYLEAARALRGANHRDGMAALARGEAMMHAGITGQQLTPVLTEGLSGAPASARGWTLLSEALLPTQKRKAAQMLAQALILAPRDFWLAEMRAKLAVQLWPNMDSNTQALATEQILLLWQDEQLHPQLFALAQTREGAALMSKVFVPDDIRAINRFIAHQQWSAP